MPFNASRTCVVYSSSRASVLGGKRRWMDGWKNQIWDSMDDEITMLPGRPKGRHASSPITYLAFRPFCLRSRLAWRLVARSQLTPRGPWGRRRSWTRSVTKWARRISTQPSLVMKAWVSQVWAAANQTGPRRTQPSHRSREDTLVALHGSVTTRARTNWQDTQFSIRRTKLTVWPNALGASLYFLVEFNS